MKNHTYQGDTVGQKRPLEMYIKSNISMKPGKQWLTRALSVSLTHAASDSPLSSSMKHTLPWALKASVSGVTQRVWKSGERPMLWREQTHSTHTAHNSCSDSPLSRRHRISARDTFSWGWRAHTDRSVSCMHKHTHAWVQTSSKTSENMFAFL